MGLIVGVLRGRNALVAGLERVLKRKVDVDETRQLVIGRAAFKGRKWLGMLTCIHVNMGCYRRDVAYRFVSERN